MTPTKTILLASIVIVSIRLNGQLCTGSLGDPVATIDFGAGPNPGGPISNVPSTYQFSNLDCPQEGFYAIRNASFSCFSSDWHILAFDHTPNDPTGYFLLVNGLAGPSLIYQQTISGLCPNTSVQVDAWVLNIFKASACSGSGIDPNLTFTITDMSGNVIGQQNTGPIAETDVQPVWTSHSFFVQCPGKRERNS